MCRPSLNISFPWIARPWMLSKEKNNILLLGCSGSGKTRFLKNLKGELEKECAPTIGFVVDNVTNKSMEWQVLDIGGDGLSNRTLPHLKDFHDRHSISIFFYECSQGDANEAIKCLEQHMQLMVDYGARFLWLVLYTNTTIGTVEEHCKVQIVLKTFESRVLKFDGQLIGNVWHKRVFTFPTEADSRRLLDEIHCTLERNANFEPRPVSPGATAADLHLADVSNAETSGEAPSIDDTVMSEAHRQFLCRVFRITVDGLTSGCGIMNMADEYLRNDSQCLDCTHGFNMSKIVFYLHQMNIVVEEFGLTNKEALSKDDFGKVMACAAPTLSQNVFKKYYSQALMNETPSYYRLPDLRDLSCLHTPSAATPHCTNSENCVADEHPERLLRYAYEIVKAYLTSDLRRNTVVELALSTLQSVTMRQRFREPAIEPYSETQTYFWIQYMHGLAVDLVSHKFGVRKGCQISVAQYSRLLSRMDYVHFKQMMAINPAAWKEHYTPHLWRSIAARQSYQAPDVIKRNNVNNSQTILSNELPNYAHWQLWKAGHVPDIPPEEELAFKAALAFHNMEIRADKQKDSHLQLLLNIYTHLAGDFDNRASWSVQSISDTLMTDDQPDITLRKVSIWIGKLVELVGNSNWVPPRSGIGNAVSVFEQFRILINTNLWLMHEGLVDVELSRQKRQDSLLTSQRQGDDDACSETLNESTADAPVASASEQDDAVGLDRSDAVSLSGSADSRDTLCEDDKSEWEVVV